MAYWSLWYTARTKDFKEMVVPFLGSWKWGDDGEILWSIGNAMEYGNVHND